MYQGSNILKDGRAQAGNVGNVSMDTTSWLSRGDYIGPESDRFENHRNVNCQHKSSGLAQGVEVNGSNTNKRSWLSNR